MWKNTALYAGCNFGLCFKEKVLSTESRSFVFPHFNDRRLKVLWECGKVGLFSRLFHISIKHDPQSTTHSRGGGMRGYKDVRYN
jgi:hypothetical protein